MDNRIYELENKIFTVRNMLKDGADPKSIIKMIGVFATHSEFAVFDIEEDDA